ncbi:MAG: branched-chain amino acid ABC transporter permease [Pirellulales bacterium]|jgi:branched-chain amino acid transport system permease protein|nr:branched-chain amino acid ABC transporter permease [Pirellulales bacterium]
MQTAQQHSVSSQQRVAREWRPATAARVQTDTVALGLLAAFAIVAPPFLGDYWLKGILIPALIFSIAALGQNIVTGYAGLISLGQAAFMAVGAFAAVIAYGRYQLPLPLSIGLGGVVSAAVGVIVGTPSLRIKGLYLLVATLAAQFLIVWLIQRVPWIGAGSAVTLNTPPVYLGGWLIDTAIKQYYLTLAIAALLTVFAWNLIRGRIGRAWMAIRDQDVAAAVMGISLLKYKLLAFMISAAYAGIAGSLIVFTWVGAANIQEFELDLSIQILGMVIIGGLGSILGSFLGAAFIALLPILISISMHKFYGLVGDHLVSAAVLANAERVVLGTLILLFLIAEPLGLARLWHRLSSSIDRSIAAYANRN